MNKETLFDYFSGKAAPLTKKRVEEWLCQPGSEEFFYECLEEWEKMYLQDEPILEDEWNKFREYIRHTPTRPDISKKRPAQHGSGRWPFFRRFLVAASVIAILSGGLGVFKDTIFYRTYSTRYGETRIIRLPDQSQVTLNTNSTLRVPRNFTSGTVREVWLSGEAFFSVTHLHHHRKFIVHARKMDIEVLGTKFNVNDRRGATQVVLQEGKVKIVSFLKAKADTILMKPGQLVKASLQEKQVALKKLQPEMYAAWRENKLVFDEMPLPEVLQTVEDHYGVRFLNQSKDTTWLRQRYTGILPNNDLHVILRALSGIYHLDIRKQEDQVIIR